MACAWACHRILFRSFVLVYSLGIWAVTSGAQQPQEPAARKNSPAPWLIVLPPKLVAGTNATLAVLDHQGRVMPKIDVTLPDGRKVTTDVTGRATFRAPGSAGKFHAEIPGGSVSTSAQVIAPSEPTREGEPELAHTRPGVITYPRILATRDRFTLEGSGFRSEPDANHISLSGDSCFVLASSPASLVALPGAHVPVGETTLRVEAGGVTAQFAVSVVFLEFSGPVGAASTGAAGQLTLRARGTVEPLLLEVRNASPDVIQLTKGNVQRLRTAGGEDNALPVDVKFVGAGSYVVSARLVSTNATTMDLNAARKHVAELKDQR